MRLEVGLVMISAGSDDGPRRGDRLHVYRDEGGRKIPAILIVESVYPDMSSARIASSFMMKIAEGDWVRKVPSGE